MASIQNILAQVFKTDQYEAWKFDCNNPIVQQPVSADMVVEGEEWFEPEFMNGVVFAYNRLLNESETSTMSIKTVRLRDPKTGVTTWILGDASDWADKANACCGATPAMDVVTYPAAIQLDAPCPEVVCTDSNPSYSYYASYTPDIVAGQKLGLSGIDENGVAFTPASSAGGFATVAAALAWAQANWGAYGTFTAEGDNGIKLTSTMTKAQFKMRPIDVSYCLTVAAGQQFDRVTNNGREFLLGKVVTVVDADQVIAVLKDYFQEGTLTKFSSTKINYVGENVPGSIKNGASVIATFAAGVCA